MRNFVKMVARNCEENYPDMLGFCFVINASFLFSSVFNLVKGFMEEETRSKIKILKDNYQKELLELVEPHNLPEVVGGTCRCEHIPGGCLMSDIGPWNPEGGLRID